MALTKEQKKEIIKDLKEKIEQQKAVVFVGFQGIKVKDISELRNKLKEIGGGIKITKKTLANLAFKEKGIGINVRELEGEVALVFAFGEVIPVIKLAYQAGLQNENLKILAGIFEGEFIDREKLIEIAQLPTREELLAYFVRVISSPVSGFVNVFKSNIKGLLYVLANAKT